MGESLRAYEISESQLTSSEAIAVEITWLTNTVKPL
jgi:hypothetical protein